MESLSANIPFISLHVIYTISTAQYHSHRSPGGEEGRMTGRRRESNLPPADRRMRDQLPRPLGDPAPILNTS